MTTIFAILKMAGGWHPGLYLKIDNAPVHGACHRGIGRARPDGAASHLRLSDKGTRAWDERVNANANPMVRPHGKTIDCLKAFCVFLLDRL